MDYYWTWMTDATLRWLELPVTGWETGLRSDNVLKARSASSVLLIVIYIYTSESNSVKHSPI